MNSFLVYLFWPNPGSPGYDSPKVQALLAVGVALLVLAGLLSLYRRRQRNARLKQMSRSWAPASFWFGLSALLLTVARVENIQFLAMRFLWVIWGLLVAVYLFFQFKRFRTQYYEVLPSEKTSDPRSAYLPKRKRR